MRVELRIQGLKVKMFDKDETIKINRKVKDYRDIENIFSDFSESFTVPGEANNNIFKHYYDADIDGSFDARVKQPAQLFVDQELFKNGVIQLKNVQIKNNKVDNYKVQFFTELTQLVETFGEDELNDLDLTAFNHGFNYGNVKQGFTTGLFNGNIIYPLISYDRRFIYNTDPNNVQDTETLINIADNGAGVPVGFSYQELKPAIKVNRIFDAIQAFYGFTFIGSIFQSVDLERMYMNLVNKEQDSQSLTSSFPITELVQSPTPPNIQSVEVTATIIPKTGFEDVEFNIINLINGQPVGESGITSGSTDTQTGSGVNLVTTSVQTSNNFTVGVNVQSADPFEYDVILFAVGFFDDGSTPQLFQREANDIVITPELQVALQFQEFKIKDFVKAFVKAFNLIVIPLSETEILFEPVQDWYRNGKVIDITPYVDNQNLEVKPGDLFSGIDFTFEKNETFLSAVFKENNNRGFGNLEEEFFDQNGDKLSGDLITIELPFEKPVFEKIAPNTQYGYFVNREQEEFLPFHSIFYIKTLSGSPVNLKNDNGTIESIPSYINPVTSENPQGSIALNFEIENDEFDLINSNITFFTKYYADYVNDVFSIKRKNYNLDARLPLQLLKNIELNDRLIIGQRRFIINSYQSDLMTQEVKFDLLNDIFSGDLTRETDGAVLSRTSLVVDNSPTQVEIDVIGNLNIKSVAIDQKRWLATFSDKKILIDIPLANDTESAIIVIGTVTMEDSSTLNFFITQKA